MNGYKIVEAYSTEELAETFGDQDIQQLLVELNEFVEPMGYEIVSGYGENHYYYVVEYTEEI